LMKRLSLLLSSIHDKKDFRTNETPGPIDVDRQVLP